MSKKHKRAKIRKQAQSALAARLNVVQHPDVMLKEDVTKKSECLVDDFSTERMSDFSHYVSRKLNDGHLPLVMVEMTIGAHGSVEIAQIHSERLPWLDEEYRVRIQNRYVQVINDHPAHKYDSDVIRKIAKLELERGLREDTSYPVVVEFCPCVFWNLWCAEDARRIKMIDGFDACNEADSRYKKESESITDSDLTVEICNIAPFKPIEIVICPHKDCFIEWISLNVHGLDVNVVVGKPLNAGVTERFASTFVPMLSTVKYLWQSHVDTLPFQLSMAGRTMSVDGRISYSADCRKLDGGMVNLSVDIGSTRTKIISVLVNSIDAGLPQDYDSNASELIKRKYKHRPGKTNGEGSFCARYDLPYFKKEDIASLFKNDKDDEGVGKLSEFIVSAIHKIAVDVYDIGFPIANVFWAFPSLNLTGQDVGMTDAHFDAVQKRVREVFRPYALGSFNLYPEHLALKHMFNHVLSHLYMRAVEEKQRIEDLNRDRENAADKKFERETAEYKQRQKAAGSAWNPFNWGKKLDLWADAPTREAVHYESLSRCFSRCLDEGSENGLGDFLILDAGGCTLDVYGERSGEQVLATSYKAGGETITDAFGDELVRRFKAMAGKSPAELRKEAERAKIRTSLNLQENPFAEDVYKDLLTESTQSVYGAVLAEICKKMQGKKRLVAVVTGGGARNPAFLELLKRNFSGNINTTSTIILGDLAVQDEKLTNDKVLYAFAACSHDQGFKGDASGLTMDNPATTLYDVAGGMLVHYQSERRG